METISVSNVNINGIIRQVHFSKLGDDLFEVTTESQPKLVIKPYSGIFPNQISQYCVTHQHGIVFAATPAEAFEKATKRYWDGKNMPLGWL